MMKNFGNIHFHKNEQHHHYHSNTRHSKSFENNKKIPDSEGDYVEFEEFKK